uniref:NADPH oxidase 1 n=1 Tax=Cyprinus carpio TaxID=7962 RepID=A0A8C1TFA9_CYPCA
MSNWIINQGLSAFILVVWMGINIFLFVYFYLFYDLGPQFEYTRELLGSALPWARAPAAVLNFNCMLILLPVCRNLLSLLRGSFICCGRTMRKQLDKNLTFHKLVAYMIALMTAVHTIAHLLNAEWYTNSFQGRYGPLATKLSMLGDSRELNTTYLNPVRSNSTTPTILVFTTIAGLTGVVITLALILMITSSMEVIRRSYFEVFWYTHHLFIVFFAGLVFHGAGRIVRSQQVTDPPHNNSLCENQLENWGETADCPVPQFAGGFPQVKVVTVTITQALMDLFDLSVIGSTVVLVHIRLVGDWTEKLIKMVENLPEGGQGPKMAVDGPFGTASEDVFDYEVSMLVGAGIGVTPFASILKSIWYKFKDSDPKLRTKKIYFYWLCRETYAFEWFADLLQVLEKDMEERGMRDFLTYKLYLTGWDQSHVNHAMVHFDKETDIITGLKQKTSYGRPNWDREFEQVQQENPSSVVGTFLCGPQALAKDLEKKCVKYSDVDPRKTKFYFNKENF